MNPIRFATVCSGIECFSVAACGLPYTPVFFSEIEPFRNAVLAHHYPDVPNLGDMTLINGQEYRNQIDLLAGGTPCQSFSQSGNRLGIRDPRGRLMLHFARLAHDARPRWVLWENVQGCLSTAKGQAFAAFLSMLTGWNVPVPKDGWRAFGVVTGRPGCYGVSWRTLDTQFVRVDEFRHAIPQRRLRVWVVAYLDSWQYPVEVLFEHPSVLGSAEPHRETRQEAPATAQICPRGSSHFTDVSATITKDCFHGPSTNRASMVAMNFEMWNVGFDCSPSLLAKRARDTFLCDSLSIDWLVRRLMPVEVERLMGLPDDYTRIPYRGKPAEDCADDPRYKACGDGWPVNSARWVLRRLADVHQQISTPPKNRKSKI